MIKGFEHYYQPGNEQFEALWDQAWIVFDASTLLDLYRVSVNTVDEAIKVIRAAKDRLWVPYQVAFEYHENLPNVRADLRSAPESARKAFSEAVTQLRSSLAPVRHPMINPHALRLVEQLEREVDAILNDDKIVGADTLRARQGVVFKIIDKFFSVVGTPFTPEELERIYKEGQDRVKRGIPPGLTDQGKTANDVEKYGDLIIWKQMLQHAKATNRPIIFVTSERKADWWWKARGSQRLGPHPLLRQEMMQEAGCEFYAYDLEGLIRYGIDYFLNRPAEKKAIEDAEAAKRAAKSHDDFLSRLAKTVVDLRLPDVNTAIGSNLPLGVNPFLSTPLAGFPTNPDFLNALAAARNPSFDAYNELMQRYGESSGLSSISKAIEAAAAATPNPALAAYGKMLEELSKTTPAAGASVPRAIAKPSDVPAGEEKQKPPANKRNKGR